MLFKVPEAEKEDKDEKFFKDILVEKFPDWKEYLDLEIQKIQITQTVNSKRHTQRQIIVKL